MNATDYVRLIKFSERIIKCATCAFSCETLTPVFPSKRPADLEAGPAGRIEKTEPAEQLAAGLFLNYPLAVAKQVPVSDHGGHVAP
jgi:hypothetical protein